jgi:signal transduction histidine kinase
MRTTRFPLSSRHIFIGVLIFATLFIDATLAYFSIQKLVRNERLIARSFKIIGELDNVQSLVKDLETTQRGYILTGDKRYLDSYKKTVSEISLDLKSLKRKYDDPNEFKIIKELETTVNQRIASTGRGITLRQKSGFEPARQFIQSGNGKLETDEINRLVSTLTMQQSERLETRAIESTESADDATRTFWIASLANIAFLILISVLLWRTGVQNFRLGQAYTDLKRAEDMRDNLTMMLVHDLRTPLTTLIGPLEMLEHKMLGPLDETQNEVIKMSRQSGQRLLGLVNQLLDVAKMEVGEFKIQRTEINTRALLQRAITITGGLELNGAKMEIEMVETESVNGDQEVLERVLINLLGNAQKFSPENSTIKLGVLKGEKTTFYVQDNGPGVPIAYQKKIFSTNSAK